MTGFIYAFQAGDRVKIGWSADPARRFVKFRTDCPYDSKILGVRPGSVSDEKEVHAQFGEVRVHGEWFSASLGLVEHVSAWPQVETPTGRRKKSPPPNCHPLRRWRIESGMTLDDLGERLDMHKSMLCRLEKGQVWPSRDFFVRVATVTDGAVTANDIVAWSPAPSATEAA